MCKNKISRDGLSVSLWKSKIVYEKLFYVFAVA